MIWDIPLCSDILIRLWTVSETGKISEEYVERNYTGKRKNLVLVLIIVNIIQKVFNSKNFVCNVEISYQKGFFFV